VPYYNAGLNASAAGVAAAGSWIAFHTADPGGVAGANQTGSRTQTTWGAVNTATVTGSQVSPTISSGVTVTHWSINSSQTSTAAGVMLGAWPLAVQQVFSSSAALPFTPVIAATSGALATTTFPDVQDRFFGIDGTAPSTSRWTVNGGGASAAAAVINSNRLQLTSGATGSYSGTDRISAIAALGTTVTDVDILTEIEFGNPSVEGYLYISARASGPDIITGTGYGVQIGTSGFVGLKSYVAGTATALYFVGSLTFSVGTKYWIDLRLQGSTISLWHWADGVAQPSSPTFTTTDTAVTTAGEVVWANTGGAAASSSVTYVRQASIQGL